MPDYDKWLLDTSAKRVLLCDIEYYSGIQGQVKYLNLSTHSQGDYGYYHANIVRTPILTRTVPVSARISITPANGYIDIDISTGGIWDLLLYNNYGDRKIVFWHGDETWSKVDFQPVFTGVVEDLEILSDTTARVNFTDDAGFVDRPITETLLEGDAENKVSPICYGEVKNITPVLLDSVAQRYKIHDGACEDVCSQLYIAGAPAANAVTKDNANGEFTVGGTIGGQITCDARGMTDTPGVVNSAFIKPGSIIQDILTRFAEIDISKIDTASVIEYDDGAGDCGVYYSRKVDVLHVISYLVSARLGWFNFTREGTFKLHVSTILTRVIHNVTAFWDTEAAASRPPGVGEVIHDIGGSEYIDIHKIDTDGNDRTALLEDLIRDDFIRVEEDGAASKFVLYRIVTEIDHGSYMTFGVVVVDSLNTVRNNRRVRLDFLGIRITSAGLLRPVAAIFDDTNIIGDIRIRHILKPPAWRFDVNYERNYTVLANANDADHGIREGFLKQEYRTSEASVADIPAFKERYANAKIDEAINTPLVHQADADIEAEIMLAQNDHQRYFIEPKATAQGLKVELGDVVKISSDRFLLSNQLYTVYSIDDDLLNGTSVIGGVF